MGLIRPSRLRPGTPEFYADKPMWEPWSEVIDAPAEPEPFYFGRPGDACAVYVIEADYGVKVGIAGTAQVAARHLAIQAACGLPTTLVRTYVFLDRDAALAAERLAHTRLAAGRMRGEWFQCHPFEATAVLDRIYADARMAAAA